MFLHKSCISLFLLPLASEQFLIIREMVFSAMNHQTVNKEFESAVGVGHSQTFRDRAQKIFSDGDCWGNIINGSYNNIRCNIAL